MARSDRRYVVVGLGRFGFAVALALVEAGEDVLAIDNDEERVQDVSQYVPNVVAASGTDERAVRALGVDSEDIAIVSCGQSLENSILSTTVLKEIGLSNIIAKAVNEVHGKILKRIGASRVVYPEREMAERLATTLLNPDVLEEIRLSKDHSIVELNTPGFLTGETLASSNLRAEFGINVLAIHTKKRVKNEDGDVKIRKILKVSPPPDYEFKKGDLMVILGKNSSLDEFKKHVEQQNNS